MPTSTLARSRSTDQSSQTMLGGTIVQASSDHPAPPALRLSDTQLDAIMRLAQPLAPQCRDVLLRILAHELRDRRDVGDGELHRLARTIISDNHLFDAPLETEPGHRSVGKYGR
jgi:hypothetical protein